METGVETKVQDMGEEIQESILETEVQVLMVIEIRPLQKIVILHQEEIAVEEDLIDRLDLTVNQVTVLETDMVEGLAGEQVLEVVMGEDTKEKKYSSFTLLITLLHHFIIF